MTLLFISFVAGILTLAAPCILPLLPIIIGGSLGGANTDGKQESWRPYVIALSLAISVIVFTLAIKATTVLLGVPSYVWQYLSAVILILLGISYLWPSTWEQVAAKLGLLKATNVSLGKANTKKGLVGAILTGLALGPVFNSCSPTYSLIVATILPASFTKGLAYLIAYATGLSFGLLMIAFLGKGFIRKFGTTLRPGGIVKRVIGVSFIIVAIFLLFGLDKKLQTYILDRGWYAPISSVEEKLR